MGKKNVGYDASLRELEQIVKKIESDECSIDELSSLVKRATVLLQTCREKLRETEKDLDSILGRIEKENDEN